MAEEIKKVKKEIEEENNAASAPPADNTDPITLGPKDTLTIPLERLDPSASYNVRNTYMHSPRKPVAELRFMTEEMRKEIKMEEVKEEPTTPTEDRPSTSFFNDSSLILCEPSQSALVPVVPPATQQEFLRNIKQEDGEPDIDFIKCWVEPWLNFKREVKSFGFPHSVAQKVMENNVEECQRALLRITEKNRRNLPENIKGKQKLKL